MVCPWAQQLAHDLITCSQNTSIAFFHLRYSDELRCRALMGTTVVKNSTMRRAGACRRRCNLWINPAVTYHALEACRLLRISAIWRGIKRSEPERSRRVGGCACDCPVVGAVSSSAGAVASGAVASQPSIALDSRVPLTSSPSAPVAAVNTLMSACNAVQHSYLHT